MFLRQHAVDATAVDVTADAAAADKTADAASRTDLDAAAGMVDAEDPMTPSSSIDMVAAAAHKHAA